MAPRSAIWAIAAADDIDAVIVCTPTDLHAQQIEQFARAGKAVFCEKPIDLDSARVRTCLDVVNETGTTLMVGFNRRFDPHFMGVKAAIANGSIGTPEMGIITSRDPGAPPADYITRSGGIFKDMMIHDFDMAVFLMGDMPEAVMATGSVLTDKSIEALGDFDSASAVLRWADGRQLSRFPTRAGPATATTSVSKYMALLAWRPPKANIRSGSRWQRPRAICARRFMTSS